MKEYLSIIAVVLFVSTILFISCPATSADSSGDDTVTILKKINGAIATGVLKP